MELEDHNCWTIAEAVGHRGPHRLQHLLSRAVWDDQQMLDIAAGWAAGHLDDGDGVLIGSCATPSSHHPGVTGPTGCTGRPCDAATSTAPAKPTNAGTHAPRQHHDHNYSRRI
jgi:hypothetical protein